MSNIQDIVIYYFSGTGNSKRIALWFSEFAVKNNIPCQVIKITPVATARLEIHNPDTLIGIISPVHGFNYPKITLDFIRNFPKGKNRIVLMNTRAGLRIANYVTPGLTGVAFMLSSFILKIKGYKIIGQIPFDMPSNFISVHPALREKTVKFLYEKNYDRVKKHSDKIFAGQTDFLAYRDLIQDILISPVSLAYYLVGRFFFAKSFYASKECNNCGVCEKSCPVKAIKNRASQPFWTFKCESCMKCMNLCPEQAIQTTHGLWIVLIILSSCISSFFFALFSTVFTSYLIQVLLFSGIFILLLWVLYMIQHLLIKNKFIAKLIVYSSLTYYKFWGRYMCK